MQVLSSVHFCLHKDICIMYSHNYIFFSNKLLTYHLMTCLTDKRRCFIVYISPNLFLLMETIIIVFINKPNMDFGAVGGGGRTLIGSHGKLGYFVTVQNLTYSIR